MNNVECLDVVMSADALPAWKFILQKGFFLRGPSGLTVREFIMSKLGYDFDFIDEDVRTIFRNNSPVDGIDEVHVQEGDKLALGGAMPGLVGIVMGRDNPYKSFRKDISCHDDDADTASEQSIRVFMKIFSTLVTKTGTDILARGIEISHAELGELIQKNKAHLLSGDGLSKLDNDPESFIRVKVAFA
ncbi:hypothetical protein [Pseudodesulfovibrio sp. zrk46]|uniref:hypothetical protein n=1 Tax=Pseudodesulfovibrio sp. zrk46 TaxID=2725288 RepID=UPI001448FF07|nr:hypothetical protein [Pseudodesulfovibrio sp. zrk46]QJB57980.1 hypothetical protein HFN16_17005 [Pseudodesulfovibrio sp. zrk46]